jgi:membrane protease YdiL (CAAX protease family)
LFVVGWLASLAGLGSIIVAIMGGGTLAARILLVVGLLVLSIGLVAGAGAQSIERRARPGLAYQGPSPFLVFAASVPVSGLAIIALGFVFGIAGLPVDGPPARLGSVLLQALVYLGLVRLLVVDGGALSWDDMGIRRPDGRAAAELLGGALWAAPVIIATLPVAYVISLLLPVTPVSPLPPAGETGGMIVNLLAGALVAPIGEEVMFRGFSTTAWVRGMGQRAGLMRGALYFALVHVLTITGSTAGEAVGLAIAAFASRIPVALVLGWLFVRRRSIWAPIGLHAAFNAILLLLAESAARSGVTPAILGG